VKDTFESIAASEMGYRDGGRLGHSERLLSCPRAALIVLSGVDRGLSLLLDSPKVLGRNEADFPLSSKVVSRKHCKVWSADGAHWIRDLESTNGTWLNGQKVDVERLAFGDVITVGDTSMAYIPRQTDEASFRRAVQAIGNETQSCRIHTMAQFSELLKSVSQTAFFERQSVTLLLLAIACRSPKEGLHLQMDAAGAVSASLRDSLRPPDKVLRIDSQTLVAIFRGQTAEGHNWAKRCREALADLDFQGSEIGSQKIAFALTSWLRRPNPGLRSQPSCATST